MRKAFIFQTNTDISSVQEALETYLSNLGLRVSRGTGSNQFILSGGDYYDLPDRISVSLESKGPGKLMVSADYPGSFLDAKIQTLKIVNNLGKIVKRILDTGRVPTESLIPGITMPQKLCENCRQPIQEGWKICPNCGTPIQTKKKESTCPSCGKQVEAAWKVCPYCGAKLVEEPEKETQTEKETEPKFCDKCGAEAPPGAMYCVKCGNPLET
nr:zinc ribbon domain-containing protein [Candidatus Freyarchaeota archaeon]